MTQEEKQLLLQDLSARLTYGVKVQVCNLKEYSPTVKGLLGDNLFLQFDYNIKPVKNGDSTYNIINDNVKPYLRPMSDMTEEEALKLWDLIYSSYRRNKILEIIIKGECIDYILDDGVTSTETFSIYYDNVVRTIDTFDWLNFHHFDYRGLIEKGLAIEAPEDMY